MFVRRTRELAGVVTQVEPCGLVGHALVQDDAQARVVVQRAGGDGEASALGVGVGLERQTSLDHLRLILLELARWLTEVGTKLGIHHLPAALVPADEEG